MFVWSMQSRTFCCFCFSQVEGKLMQIDVTWNSTDFRAETSDFVCKHAWRWDLDSVVPVVVIVTKSVGEVENSWLRDLRRVLGNIEMSWLHGTLGDWMWDQEEVKLTIFNFRLLDEACIDVGSLRRVLDELVALLGLSLLEKSLSHTFVNNDECYFRRNERLDLILRQLFVFSFGIFSFLLSFLLLEQSIFFSHDLMELVKFLIDNHLSHRITNSITIDENVFRHRAIEVSIALECSLEVVRKHTWRDNFLTFLRLGSSLCVILTKVWIVSSTETNSALFTFMADINTNKHSFVGDFCSKGHTPQISTNFCVHLSNDVHEDTIIILCYSTVSNKLWNDWCLTVNFILEEWVKILMVWVIWHDDQEDESRFRTACDMRLNSTVVIELNTLCECLE